MAENSGTFVPALGDRVPRQGNALTRAVGRGVLRLLRWRVEGTIPNRDKLLVVVAPHTTGWDFPIAMVTLLAIGVRASWLGIDWVVRYPFMKTIGGISVDRGERQGLVPRAIAEFKNRSQYFLGLSPEGSRQKVVPWKTGFYRIAVGARVPMLLVSIDQHNKVIRIGPLIYPSGNYNADMDTLIRPFYNEYVDRYSDRFGF